MDTLSSREKLSILPIVLGISITTMASIPVFLTGALAVQIRQNLHLDASQLGAAVAVFFASASLTSIQSGKLAQHSGFEKIMRVGVVMAMTALTGIGLLAHSYPVFLIFLSLAGITNGMVQPAINLFLSDVIPRSRQGIAFGIKQAAIPVATFISGLAVPVVALTIGWHYAYLMIAPIGIVLFFLIPRQASPDRTEPRGSKAQSKVFLAPLVVLAVGMGLGSSAANGLSAFLVSSSVYHHWSPGTAGILVVIGSVTGMASRLLNGILADRRNGRHFQVVAMMVGLGGVGYLMLMSGVGWLIVPATIISYGAGWGWNGLFNFAVVWNYPTSAGYATGITQSGAYIGSVFGPLLFGFIVDQSGYNMAWSSTAVEAFAASLAIIIARRMILSAPEHFAGRSGPP